MKNKLIIAIILIFTSIAAIFVGVHICINMISNLISEDQRILTELKASSVSSTNISNDIIYYTNDIKAKEKQIEMLHNFGF